MTSEQTEKEPVSNLSIDEAVTEVKQIITSFEEAELELSTAKQEYERATELLNHIESEVALSEGEINRVETDSQE